MSELPHGWSLVTVDQVTACERYALAIGPFGSSLKVSDYRSYGVPLVFVRNIRASAFGPNDLRYVSREKAESLLPHQVSQGDLLITKMGNPPGDATIYPLTQPGIVTADCIKMTPHPSIDARYLLHAFATRDVARQINAITQGVAQRKVSLERFRKGVKIPLAPRVEQQRITAVVEEQFSRLDAGVAALERARQNLKRMRAAALDGLLRADDGTDFPLVELGEILTHGRYGTSTKCSADGAGLPVLRIPNVQSGKIDLSDLKYAIDSSLDLTGSRVSEGDVLIIRTNGSRSLIGRAAVVPQIQNSTAFASYLIQLRMDPNAINPSYLAAVLAAPCLRTRLEDLAATTAGQYNISLGKLRSLRVPLPTLTEQSNALSSAEGQLSIADHIDGEVGRSLSRSNLLRSSILDRAFGGGLVPQDLTEEPASVLLARIAAERASSNGNGAVRGRWSRVVREEVTS